MHQLQTEIKIHKAMRHVNVVKFERVFDDRDFYFIVMELCDYNVSKPYNIIYVLAFLTLGFLL